MERFNVSGEGVFEVRSLKKIACLLLGVVHGCRGIAQLRFLQLSRPSTKVKRTTTMPARDAVSEKVC